MPALAFGGQLTVPVLALFMAVFGLFNLTGDAASQSFLPRIVPSPLLTRAHAAIDQSSAVAQTGGPALGGGLVSLVGAPWTVLVDAVSYLASGLVLLTIRVEEPAPDHTRRAPILAEIGEGLRWVYRHRMLGPLALTGHTWFFFTGIAGAVLAP
ncbi:hypothetical protein ABIB25_005741 [Nakamurella sp. UYEF19]